MKRIININRNILIVFFCAILIIFVNGCAVLKSRMFGPPHRFHTKILWYKDLENSLNNRDGKIRIVYPSQTIDEHDVVGLILVRGWQAASFSPKLEHPKLMEYLKNRLVELNVDGIKNVGIFDDRENWGFMENASITEQKMKLIHYTEENDKDPIHNGTWGEIKIVGEMYRLK